MIFPQLASYSGTGLLLLRIVVGIIFISSGWNHFTNPLKRSRDIGMSTEFTFILGIGEFLSAICIIFGLFIQIGSFILMMVMGGAIYFKIFKWNIGFYNEEKYGWHYDLLIFSSLTVIFLTGGGKYVLLPIM